MAPTVLVTGASGYLGAHCVHLLLNQGYKVKATVRSMKAESYRKSMFELQPHAYHQLKVMEAELSDESCWLEAVKGCDYVIHVASPVRLDDEVPDEEIIRPSLKGTMAILNACLQVASVKRVVLTGSIAAINAGDVYREEPWTEEDWISLSKNPSDDLPYCRSKTLTERAAWQYMADHAEACHFELVVLNPCAIVGPPLFPHPWTTMDAFKQLMEDTNGFIPKYGVACIDVRDVALAHITAMHAPAAAGNRHIIAGDRLWLREVAEFLREEFASQGYEIPTIEKSAGQNRFPPIEKIPKFDTTRMKKVLCIHPRGIKASILEMVYTMIEFGLITKEAGLKKKGFLKDGMPVWQ